MRDAAVCVAEGDGTAVSEVPRPSTVAVIVNTDPLAALEGFTVSVVVVAVCAPATAQDIAMNKDTHREVKRPFNGAVFR